MTDQPVAEAASVLLAREAGSREVFLVERASTLRFMGGFHAFPGGRVHEEDHLLAQTMPGLTAQQVAGVRELFEETGVLLGREESGALPSEEKLTGCRQELLAAGQGFPAMLERLRLRIVPEDVVSAGSLVTPAFSVIRFDTGFFVAVLPPGQRAEVWPGELASGHWTSASASLLAWARGDLLLSPPTVSILEVLHGRSIEELPARLHPLLQELATGAIPPIWFSPGVLMIPLRSCALPPSTHTNAYRVGTDSVYLIDPGPTDLQEQAQLFALLESDSRNVRRASSNAPIDAVVLTHHHPDHIGAAVACARRYQVPILAHPWTARALQGQVPVDREIRDGDQLDLGVRPDGRGRWHLQALHTPGHAPGHLAFFESSYGLLFVGDMISTLSSVVVAPPEGNLCAYLESLRRLQECAARMLLPAHGGVSSRPGFLLDRAQEHRRIRETQLLAALGTEPRQVEDLARMIYQGLPARLMPFAELQTLAGLQKLEAEGRAQQHDKAWRAPGEGIVG